ncbi:MAG: type 4a pilus biogenesis protein PilO [Patescibacteria group bacterium]
MNQKLTSAIVAAASILIFFFLVMPSFDKTLMIRASMKDREDILREAEQISKKIVDLDREIESRRQEVEKLDRLLPAEKEIPELLSSIESIVSASGMILSEMNLSEVPGQSEIRKINGNMKLNGSYASFINFLDLFEKNLRLTEVATLDVAAQLIEGSRALNFDIRFEVNYLANESVASQ